MDIRISDWTKLGSVLRDARKARGLSQHELASRGRVSRSWLARLEAGHRGAELEPLFRLLNALGLTLSLRDLSESDGPQQSPVDADASRAENDEDRSDPEQWTAAESPRARTTAEQAAGQLAARTEAVRRATRATPQINAATDAVRRAQAALAPALSVVAKHQTSAASRRQAWQDASAYLSRSDVQEAIRRAARLTAQAQGATGATRQPPGHAEHDQPDDGSDDSSSSEPDGGAEGHGHA